MPQTRARSKKKSPLREKKAPSRRPPSPDRIDGGADTDQKLTGLQKAHLLVDSEKHPSFQFKSIIQLNEPYYRTEQEAFWNHFNHLKQVKKNSKRQIEYYNLVAAAQTVIESPSRNLDTYFRVSSDD